MRAYLQRLQRLTKHVDPTIDSPMADAIRAAGESLDSLSPITVDTLSLWAGERPRDVYTLGLACGLSQEKLKNLLKHRFGTSGWYTLANSRPVDLIQWLEDEFGLLGMIEGQQGRAYSFGDVLAARGTSRQTASSAGVAGRLIENRVEGIVSELGLSYEMRGRFTGRGGDTAPADLAIPDCANAQIAVACKGFDSTGSKLTAAVTEIADMANVRYANQFVMAVVDGIGWLSRRGDFRRLHEMAETRRIDGLYAMADMDRFRDDLVEAARRLGLMT